MNTRGEQAMQIIQDYPLYASTSGIAYDEAIAIALVPDGDFAGFLAEDERISNLTKEELEAELKNKGVL